MYVPMISGPKSFAKYKEKTNLEAKIVIVEMKFQLTLLNSKDNLSDSTTHTWFKVSTLLNAFPI